MPQKNCDRHNRWRNKIVSFRMSPEENRQLNELVLLSGLTKQDYIIHRLLNREVVVQGNTRVFKALRNQLAQVLYELRHLETGQSPTPELLETIQMMSVILVGMGKEVSEDV